MKKIVDNKRQDLLMNENLKFISDNQKNKVTKKEKIEGLNRLVKCMKHFKEKSEKELQEIYIEEMNRINEEYNK